MTGGEGGFFLDLEVQVQAMLGFTTTGDSPTGDFDDNLESR